MRIADSADLENVTGLINLAFQVEKFFIDGDRISLDGVRELAGKGTFLLIEDAGGLGGCVYVEPRGERAYLGLLSVNPARQRSGIGSQLMSAAEEHCRAAGCRFLDLRMVNVREELPAFYQRMGYREAGTAPLPPDVSTKIPCHFVNMTKALDRASEAAG